MPKRIGFLYEDMISLDNCIQAEKQMAKNKPDNRMARHIGAHAEKYGKELQSLLENKTWTPGPSRKKDIRDSYKGKTRHLEIPCLLDQSAQYAWLLVAIPHIEKRNYYYNCGSIPGAGQLRAVRAVQKWLGSGKPPKYALTTDVYHFYQTCPHSAVMAGLRRIFKDKKFLDFAALILTGMGENGVGLSIGHPSSHWFANVALMPIDHELKRKFPTVKFTRYMDDISANDSRKRRLHRFRAYLSERLEALGMRLKGNWQVFPIAKRPIQFLSYRFSHGFTRLAKKLMFRVARKVKKAKAHLDAHTAAGVLSYMGILKHCNSYHFREKRVYPYININKCKEVVRNESKNRVWAAA